MSDLTSLNQYLQSAIRTYRQLPALTDFHGTSYTFDDVAVYIAKLHIVFDRAGLKPGDKIALCGRNSSRWSMSLMAVMTYGAVAVPILNDFTPETVHHLVNHSESRLLFVGESNKATIDPEAMPELQGIILIEDMSLVTSRDEVLSDAFARLDALYNERYPDGLTDRDIHYADVAPDNVVLINYTSGSTGFSKGVMLTALNMWSNIQFCLDHLKDLEAGDTMLSMLPLAHMFGMLVELFNPFVRGCHTYFLTRTPSPRVLLEAFAEVKPKLIVAVPLIIEKIIKTRVFPVLDKPMMKFMLHVPGLNRVILSSIKKKLLEAFGGQMIQMIIGGAGLNKDVESFLRKIRFPYTVGYGMTECAPLIAYAPWDVNRSGSCGRIVDRMQARIDSDDPTTTPGVLWVKGDNVMAGYYKNPEATEAVMDGSWMNTGDICNMDSDGFLYIRGRDKSMILGPSGQNIYPEEIEQRLNNMPLVAESLVVDAGEGQLKALIYPDYEAAKHQGISEADLAKLMEQNIATLNKDLPAYSRVKSSRLMTEEFEKTPKRSIKRFLYQS